MALNVKLVSGNSIPLVLAFVADLVELKEPKAARILPPVPNTNPIFL